MHTNSRPVDDVNLGEYVQVLWRSRILILIAAAVCAAVAFVLAITSPRVYEAEVSLAVSRPKLADSPPDTTPAGNFLPFVASRSVATQVIKEFGLDKPPNNLLSSTFFETAVTVEEVRASTIILVKGTLSDPVLVTRVVNRVAELGVEAARLGSQSEALQARNDIEVQLKDSRTRMELAEAGLQKFREASQVEVLRKDVDSALYQRSGLLDLAIDIEADKSRLAKAEQELAARQKLDTVKRSIDSDPLLLDSARKTPTGQTSDLLGLQLRSEEVNPVYQRLDEDVARTRTELAGKERLRAQLSSRKLDTPHLSQLNDLYKTEAELSRLEMERDLSRKIYLAVATSYETARLSVAGRSSALQIIGAAGVPDRPLSRNVVRNTAMAFFAGLLISSVGVLLYSVFSSASLPASRTV
jgi:uncharacterized protein involved in exopolysaccharide biosynthesis